MDKIFNSLPSKYAFWLGMIEGFLILSTIGFFVLLTIFITSGAFGVQSNKTAQLVNNAAPSPSAAQPSTATSTPKIVTVKGVSADDHIFGNKDAQIFIIEYSDLECPFCKRFHSVAQQAVDAYKGKVAWVFRNFPLPMHANAEKEAEATECAADLGGNDIFWKYTNAIIERTTANGTGFSLTALVPLAKELGLDEKKFQNCLDTGKFASKIQKEITDGKTAGISSVPASVLWTKSGKTQFVPGAVPFDTLKQAIDSLL